MQGQTLLEKISVILEGEWFGAVQDSNRLALKNATSEMVSLVETMTLTFNMGDSRVRADLDVVHNLAIPVLIGTSNIDRSIKSILKPEQKIVPVLPSRFRFSPSRTCQKNTSKSHKI